MLHKYNIQGKKVSDTYNKGESKKWSTGGWSRDMVQVVESLTSMQKALGSIPSTTEL